MQELHPLYATTFSDAYPRCMMVLKQLDCLPPWFDRNWEYYQRWAMYGSVTLWWWPLHKYMCLHMA